jgi:hypothetical protein
MKDKRNEDLVHLKIKCRDNKTIAALLFLNQETKKKILFQNILVFNSG